jgi:hypothetical protein
MEYATSSSGGGPFPASWGRPKGSPQSEERQQWVREQVRHHLAGAPLRQLRKRQIEMLNQLRMAQVERLRREGPLALNWRTRMEE